VSLRLVRYQLTRPWLHSSIAGIVRKFLFNQHICQLVRLDPKSVAELLTTKKACARFELPPSPNARKSIAKKVKSEAWPQSQTHKQTGCVATDHSRNPHLRDLEALVRWCKERSNMERTLSKHLGVNRKEMEGGFSRSHLRSRHVGSPPCLASDCFDSFMEQQQLRNTKRYGTALKSHGALSDEFCCFSTRCHSLCIDTVSARGSACQT
jgi:hypothetical protein